MSNVVPFHRPASLDGKQPPHDPMAEAATLTACILNQEVSAQALAIASPEDFFWAAHQAIARTVAEFVLAGEAWDETTLVLALKAKNRMGVVGDPGFVAGMMAQVPAIPNVAVYARRVHELAQVRRLQVALHQLVAESYEPMADVSAWMSRVDVLVGEHTRQAARQTVSSALESAKEAARLIMDASKPRVTTGFTELDERTTGLEGSRLYIVAGRTGMGKSAFAGQMALAACLQGKTVLYCSLEMPKGELATRIICAIGRVPADLARKKRLDMQQMSRFSQAASDLARLPLHIDASTTQSLLHIRSTMRQVKADVVIVDHIGLLKPAQGSANRKRNEIVGEFSRGLKALAMETDKPVVALCQVGREVARDGARPGLHHLKDSGDIEQDADTVLFLHRPGYYDPSRGSRDPEAEVIIAKQRAGETGIIHAEYDAAHVVFREVTRDA